MNGIFFTFATPVRENLFLGYLAEARGFGTCINIEVIELSAEAHEEKKPHVLKKTPARVEIWREFDSAGSTSG